MDWYCDKCGAIVYEYDLPENLECSCGGSFEECERCSWCDEWRNPETMMCFPCSGFAPICPECFGKLEDRFKEAFLKKSADDPDRPDDTWGDYFEEIKAVPVFKVETFFDFCRWEDEANIAFYHYCRREITREAVKRGRMANVKVHYKEAR